MNHMTATHWLLRSMLVAVLTGAAVAAEPAKPIFSFAADGAEKQISGSTAQVTFAKQPGDKLEVTIKPGADAYPGITIKPNKLWNLKDYGHVEVKVTNTGSAEFRAVLRIDNEGDWKSNPWNAEAATVKPGASATIKVCFGYSWTNPGFALKPKAVAKALVFIGKTDAEQKFTIEGLAAGGTPGEMP